MKISVDINSVMDNTFAVFGSWQSTFISFPEAISENISNFYLFNEFYLFEWNFMLMLW